MHTRKEDFAFVIHPSEDKEINKDATYIIVMPSEATFLQIFNLMLILVLVLRSKGLLH